MKRTSLKITYIHQHFRKPTESGGGRPYEFARRLADAGHKVTVIASGSERSTYTLDGFTVIQVKSPYDNRMSKIRRLLSFSQFMARSTLAALSTKSDLVFASSTPLTVAVPGMMASWAQRSPFVLEVRDLWPEAPIALGYLPKPLHGIARALEKVAYRRAATVIALSPGMAEGVRTVSPSTHVVTIPNCSDNSQRRPSESGFRQKYNIPPHTPLYYYAGSLGAVYDTEWLAKLAIALHSVGSRLLVAGDGSGLEVGRELLEAAGMDPDETFIGPIPRTAVFDLANESSVAVSSVIDHPTLRHASINKVFDAMAAGKPVVFNHTGWISDLVRDEGAGWVWPRHASPDQLAHLALHLDEEKIRLAGERSLALAERSFDRELLFQDFKSSLESAVAE